MLGIKKKVAKTARKAGLMTGGLLLCAVGIAFLTVAGWLALVPAVGATTAAMIIAGVYIVLGLILIGVAAGGSKDHHVPHAATEVPERHAKVPNVPPLVQAFLFGLQAGSDADRKRR